MRITGVFLLVAALAAVGCHQPVHNNLPPSEMLAHPGPGVDGPGPGVLAYQPAMSAVAASSQIYFVGPEGLTVQWDVTAPGRFDSEQLVAPARYNFPQGALYRLKLTNIPGRPGVELFPTIEVAATLPRTEAFLAHNAIPVEFTDEDFDQVMTGNFVTKVVYLPDPEFQEPALAGVGTLVSTKLDPGQDPIVEADRKGAIMAIVRLGNKDLGIASAMPEQMPGGPGMVPGGPEMAPGGMGMMPGGMGMAPGMCPPGYVAGVTAPQYGMPITGTPIGLVGPPHVPLGVPAGLQQHVMVNHTHVCLPQPETKMRIDVKQEPGIHYPEPVNHVRVVERANEVGRGGVACPQACPTDGAAPCPTGGAAPCPTGNATTGAVSAPAVPTIN
jgi:hypothetical protein